MRTIDELGAFAYADTQPIDLTWWLEDWLDQHPGQYWQLDAEEAAAMVIAMEHLQCGWDTLGYRVADTAQSGAIHLEPITTYPSPGRPTPAPPGDTTMNEELIATLENALSYENGIKGTLAALETACARQWSHARALGTGPEFDRHADHWQRCWDIVSAALRAAVATT